MESNDGDLKIYNKAFTIKNLAAADEGNDYNCRAKFEGGLKDEMSNNISVVRLGNHNEFVFLVCVCVCVCVSVCVCVCVVFKVILQELL